MNQEQVRNPIDAMVICDAYESGYGHGFQRDKHKYGRSCFASKEEADAYSLGYEKGKADFSKPKELPEGWRLVQMDYQRIFNAIGAAVQIIPTNAKAISVRAFWEHLDNNQPKPEGYV